MPGGFTASPIAFEDDGMRADTVSLIEKRQQNQERVATGRFQKFRPHSGNQEIYNAFSQRKDFGCNGKPRGYSRDYWNTIDRSNSVKKRR